MFPFGIDATPALNRDTRVRLDRRERIKAAVKTVGPFAAPAERRAGDSGTDGCCNHGSEIDRANACDTQKAQEKIEGRRRSQIHEQVESHVAESPANIDNRGRRDRQKRYAERCNDKEAQRRGGSRPTMKRQQHTDENRRYQQQIRNSREQYDQRANALLHRHGPAPLSDPRENCPPSNPEAIRIWILLSRSFGVTPPPEGGLAVCAAGRTLLLHVVHDALVGIRHLFSMFDNISISFE